MTYRLLVREKDGGYISMEPEDYDEYIKEQEKEELVKDFLGNEYTVGSLVIYPVSYGSHSVMLAMGKVLKISEKSVQVEPVEASRGKHYYGRTRYIDNRTGKGIDPYCNSGKHIEEEGHYILKETGSRLARTEVMRYGYGQTEYIPAKFKDYVERVNNPTSVVTLKVTSNIVLARVPKKELGDVA